jgi:hypothetical protein
MKRRLSAALAKASEAWRAKKRQRIDGAQAAGCSSNEHVTLAAEVQSTIPQAIEASQAVECSSNGNVTADLQSNVDLLSPVHSQVRFHAPSAM